MNKGEKKELGEQAIVAALPKKFTIETDKQTGATVLAVVGSDDMDTARGTLIRSLFILDEIKKGGAEERDFLPATFKFLEYLRNKKATSFQQLPKEDRDKIIKDGIMKFALGLPDPANIFVPSSNTGDAPGGPNDTGNTGNTEGTGGTGDPENKFKIGLNVVGGT